MRIGNAVLGLWFEGTDEAESFAQYLGRPSSDLEADLSLTIRYRNDAGDDDPVPNSLFLTKVPDGDGFSAGDGLIRGRFSPASGEGELIVQNLINDGGYARIYEQIFFQAYWSAARRKGLNSFLLHSSGAVRQGRGWVFCGTSGAGKSTSVSLSQGKAAILNDEITVIDLADTPLLRDTPFNGFFPSKEEGWAPLGGILLLKQAPLHRLTRVTGADAVKTLAREVIPPLGLESFPTPGLFMEMLDLAEKAKARVPLYVMEFLRDPGFWDHIDQLKQEPV